MNKLDVHFSSEKQDWETPQEFFDKMTEKYGPFNLDAAASQNNKKCDVFLDGSYGKDGLDAWPTIDGKPAFVWLNPPYGRGLKKWVKHAYEQSLLGHFVVMLIPARTDTSYFHDYCIKGQIEFIRGRLKFSGHKNSAPFPSMIVVFGLYNG